MSQRLPHENGRKIFKTPDGNYIAQPNDLLGKGTYGVVYKVTHEKDPRNMKAVKTFTPETMDESEGIPSTTLREINALKVLNHPNVLKSEAVIMPEDSNALTEMFVLMELCQGTLKDKAGSLIQKHLDGNPKWATPHSDWSLPASYVREAKIIAWQLLNSMAYVHSRGIMHRDLKPVNIMWGFNGLLKLGDFGLARFVRGNQYANDLIVPQTGEVQTMWYRAPEVLLGDEQYGMAVDDWSVGCIIAELFRFRISSRMKLEPDPLFCGKSDTDTLLLILETLGTPRHDNTAYVCKLPFWSPEVPRWFNGTLRKRVSLIDNLGYEVLRCLLTVSPSERHASRFLLDHSWFDDVREDVKMFVPWWKGMEETYQKMMAVDRLPLPKPLRVIEEEKLREKERKEAKENQPPKPPVNDMKASLSTRSQQTKVESTSISNSRSRQPSASHYRSSSTSRKLGRQLQEVRELSKTSTSESKDQRFDSSSDCVKNLPTGESNMTRRSASSDPNRRLVSRPTDNPSKPADTSRYRSRAETKKRLPQRRLDEKVHPSDDTHNQPNNAVQTRTAELPVTRSVANRMESIRIENSRIENSRIETSRAKASYTGAPRPPIVEHHPVKATVVTASIPQTEQHPPPVEKKAVAPRKRGKVATARLTALTAASTLPTRPGSTMSSTSRSRSPDRTRAQRGAKQQTLSFIKDEPSAVIEGQRSQLAQLADPKAAASSCQF